MLAQGLKNGPPTFQRVVDYVLQKCKGFAIPYFDDIIIGSANAEDTWEEAIEEHEGHIRLVLHILENGTRRPAPGKLTAA